MSILSKITGPKVRLAGYLITGITGVLLHKEYVAIFYLLFLAVAVLAQYTKTFNFLKNFADPNFWPAFVALGICILLAAHVGGVLGILACIGPLTAYDGMYFDQNY